MVSGVDAAASLVAGLDSTTVDVLGATDCSRDVADGAPIHMVNPEVL